MIWRIWIPTWRFFNSVPPLPRLEVQFGLEWVLLTPRPRRRLCQLFLNPDWTRYHAINNLLLRLVEESQSAKDVEDLASFKLVNQIVSGRNFRIVQDSEVVFEKRGASV